MDAYIASLIPYAIAANAVAIPLILLGLKFGQRCHPIEYVMLYFSWGVFVLLIGSVFDSFPAAMQELEVNQNEMDAVFGVAGFFSGLSLLTKLLFSGKKVNAILLTTFTSICVAVLVAKFAVLAFLFTVEGF